MLRALPPAAALALALAAASVHASSGLQVADLYRLRSVGDVQISPDGTRIAYTVAYHDRPGAAYARVWTADIATQRTEPLGNGGESSIGPRWSPDGSRLAYFGAAAEGTGLLVRDMKTGKVTYVAPVSGTNHPLPSAGERLSWAPDGRAIAFISTTPGPEVEANGDPMVITRYLYKPGASEGSTRFNDNRRTHIFVADLTSGGTRQLTTGNYYEHSIDWSPDGAEIAFVSNRGPDPDRFFNYDIFAVNVGTGAVRRVTDTRSAEYYPRWSPDGRAIAFAGTTRPLTSSETTMEDTHVWVTDRDGRERREIGAAIDNRQGAPAWSADGAHVYFTVQERGTVKLVRVRSTGGAPEAIVAERGSVGAWSEARGLVAYALTGDSGPAELFLRSNGAHRRVTALNTDWLRTRPVAPVESFTFRGPGDLEVEAFLTKPAALTGRHPLIVMIHGGPHSQQGPAFNPKAQIYAAQGWATLMVNYRGSTGYGQRHADAIFRDQNGAEARDILAGVDAAIARYPWIDGNRLGVEGGSYGGQLTNWLVTQTNRFRAAVSFAGIANLVSFNYTAYYHDYLAVEFGAFPHEPGVMDLLWERSPIRYVRQARTPTLLLHGEGDNDVPISEAEQFYIALLDVGVETQMVRYPREGHGLRETKHVADSIERSIAWYRRYFADATRDSAHAVPQSAPGVGAR